MLLDTDDTPGSAKGKRGILKRESNRSHTIALKHHLQVVKTSKLKYLSLAAESKHDDDPGPCDALRRGSG